MARYGQSFKDRAVARLLAPECADVNVVAQQVGVRADTLARWRSEVLSSGVNREGWTAGSRLEAVLATAALSEEKRNAWCRERGVFPSEIDAWREAATRSLERPGALSDRSTRAADRKRVRELERDLKRKEKALAEAAALLVLSKKLEAIFQQDADA